jgi:hypothetical protein
MTNNNCYGDYSMVQPKNYMPDGRYPSQTFVNSETAKILDEQSGIQKGNGHFNSNVTGMANTIYQGGFKDFEQQDRKLDDTGGCSRILHKCDYDEKDFDIYIYCPKVNNFERNAGCEKMEDTLWVQFQTANNTSGVANNWSKDRNTIYKNTHPTVKPINLLIKILSLFKTPNPQIVLDTFAGSGSIGIACEKLNMDYILVEMNKEYCDIAELRIKYWAEKFKNKQNSNKNDEPIDESQLSLF